MLCIPEEQAAESKQCWRLYSMVARYTCPTMVSVRAWHDDGKHPSFTCSARTRDTLHFISLRKWNTHKNTGAALNCTRLFSCNMPAKSQKACPDAACASGV